jgi:hypothetical protein
MRFVLIFGLLSTVQQARSEPKFVPFKVQCSIYAHQFPGTPDIETDLKEVVLEGENETKAGHQWVGEHGDYSFYVVTRETLGGNRRSKKTAATGPEVYAYDAEIRNKKTGVVAQARSAGKGESHEGAVHQASVSLVTYPKGGETPLLVEGMLSLHCHHPKDPVPPKAAKRR